MRGLRDLGYEFTNRFDTLVPVQLAGVLQLFDAKVSQVGMHLTSVLGPVHLAMPLCAHISIGLLGQLDCLAPGRICSSLLVFDACVFMKFRMGCHGLPMYWAAVNGSLGPSAFACIVTSTC
jgi:hypothetical protein